MSLITLKSHTKFEIFPRQFKFSDFNFIEHNIFAGAFIEYICLKTVKGTGEEWPDVMWQVTGSNWLVIDCLLGVYTVLYSALYIWIV